MNYATFACIGVLLKFVNLRATNNCLIGCLVPLVYDTLLTMSDEVDLIWRRKWSAASVIFIMNRVALVFTAIAAILSSINTVRRQPSNAE